VTALIKPEDRPMRKPWNAPLQVPDCPEGWTTGPPDYVGIGAQRCGTSWWYDSMRRYPGIQRSPLGKEVHYFDRYWQGNAPDDVAAEYASLFPRRPGSIVGEWTPRYLADPWAIRLLTEAAPKARLLVMLRDPVARYRSAIARLSRLAEERGGRVLLTQVNDAVWRGFYFEQLRHVFELFPRDQVLVLQFERCAADPVPEMERTLRFLGMEPPDEPPERLMLHKQAGRTTAELPPMVSEELAERYRNDSRQLAELCPELDLSLWPSVSGSGRRAARTVPQVAAH
jgi:Sulfotransferase domain